LEIEDSPFQDIQPSILSSLEFILDSQKEKEKNILIHCAAGISRSPTIVLAYLMKYHEMNLNDALRFVQEKRPIIHPNPGFQKQLQEYANELNLSGLIAEDIFS
jgi:protein-tyrosine phosphatase